MQGWDSAVVRDWATLPLAGATPVADAARTPGMVLVERPEEWERDYPHLQDLLAARGYGSFAVWPLVVAGESLGALAVGFGGARALGAEERATAGALAEQGGQAAGERERPGRVAIVVGDVVGHGPRAAGAMGQLRSALAAYLIDGHGPAEALERLDRFARRVDGATAGTVPCGVLDRDTGALRWARAGHVPALLADESEARFLGSGSGTVLRVRGRPPFVEESTVLAPGAIVLLYTDGLVERRGRRRRPRPPPRRRCGPA